MHPDPSSRVDLAIAALAGAQHGVVSHAQLIAVGATLDSIKWRLRTGRLHRLHRGVYLVGHAVQPPRAAEMAAQLACEPRSQISHRSAAVMLELIAASEQRGPVDVTVIGRDPNRQEGIRLHRVAHLEPWEIEQQGAIRLTSPARTLLDLAAVARPWELENAVAQARRKKRVSDAEIDDQIARNPGRRGVRRLRRLREIEGGPALSRSRPERRLLRLIRSSSLPTPKTNEVVCGLEVDMAWPEHKLVVEFDSREFHSDPLAFERDRLRDARLVANGYRVIRITHRELRDAPQRVVNHIRQARRAIETGLRGDMHPEPSSRG